MEAAVMGWEVVHRLNDYYIQTADGSNITIQSYNTQPWCWDSLISQLLKSSKRMLCYYLVFVDVARSADGDV